MPETTAPIPVVQEPTKLPPPDAGSAAIAPEGEKKTDPVVDNPFEFELDVKGQKQKMNFKDKAQLTAILQKALYADQVIKDASQAKKGAAELMQKLKTRAGRIEVFSDPEIGVDIKQDALEIVKEMMEDEKLTPEQREARTWKAKAEKYEAEQEAKQAAEAKRVQDEKTKAQAQEIRTEIIGAMKKYPDIPQTQATMDAVILNMRAAYQRFGKHLTPEQAMTVYSQQYWTSLKSVIDKMPDEELIKRFDQKTIDRIQKMKLNELKEKTDPSKLKQPIDGEIRKKKSLSEKDFDKHFSKNILPLAGL